MSRRHLTRLATIFLCLACFALYGQIGTEGVFFGTVTDSSGSSVPGAEVVATHLSTGVSKQAVTDAQGNFNLFALPIGKYSVTVKAKGFKTWTSPEVELTVGDRSRLTPVLAVGEISESVSVIADSELLQTEKSSAQTVVQLQQVRELPLQTRNPLALVAMVPGMRYLYTQSGGEKGTYVQGQGLKQNKTQFTLDGTASNAPMDEGGTAVPNVDSIAELSVETLNFSAENGRGPTQVKIATKSGSNEFHGQVWEYNQNDAYNARNTFALATPRVRYNQFGAALGGPVIKNHTFFYGNFQGTKTSNQQVFNSKAVTADMKAGNFSGISTVIKDPMNLDAQGNPTPFPNNIIPEDRINPSSKFFLDQFLVANSPDGFFKANAGTTTDTWEGTGRVDHQITDSQRIYGRYVIVRQPSTQLGYAPTAVTDDLVSQHNVAVNYTWTMSPNTVLALGGGMMRTSESYTSPDFGKTNLAEQGGVQGFPTPGREAWIGAPNISFGNGWEGNSYYPGWGVPGRLWGSVYDFKADVHHYRGSHSLAAGAEYADVHTYASHGSCCVRGNFNFNNQYTGDGFADYLLGYASSARRDAPLNTFGTDRAPYLGLFANDDWRVKPNLTIQLGLRYERWFSRHNLRDGAASWDPKLNKIIAANMSDGNINQNVFLSTPNVIASTQGLVVTARSAGYPDSLWTGHGNWAPRLGLVYRPFGKRDFVIRGAYGLFYNAMTGNRSASAVANPPFWGVDTLTFGANELHPWNTDYSTDPNAFGIFGIGESQDPNLKQARTQEWNVTIQTALPFKSALTLSYVGTSVADEVAISEYNIPVIGPHDNLQDDRPVPQLAGITRTENIGHTWYNALQTKVERRFSQGITFTFAYSFSRAMGVNAADSQEYFTRQAYSPDWYNRGRMPFDIRHIEFASLVWEMPFGHGRKFASNMGRVADAVIGGWNLSLVQAAQSGTPFTVGESWQGTYSLGNGEATRPDLIGDPHVSNPTPALWFNRSAFAAAAPYTFGSAPLNVLEGPGAVTFSTSLSKRFRVAEGKMIQIEGQAFNVFNHVNYDQPDANWQSTTAGQITSAGPARYMQLGAKFIF